MAMNEGIPKGNLPQLVNRLEKGDKLTHLELDNNFQMCENLKGYNIPKQSLGVDGDYYTVPEHLSVTNNETGTINLSYDDSDYWIYNNNQKSEPNAGSIDLSSGSILYFKLSGSNPDNLEIIFSDNNAVLGTYIELFNNEYEYKLTANLISNGSYIINIPNVYMDSMNVISAGGMIAIRLVTATIIPHLDYVKVQGEWQEFTNQDLIKNPTTGLNPLQQYSLEQATEKSDNAFELAKAYADGITGTESTYIQDGLDAQSVIDQAYTDDQIVLNTSITNGQNIPDDSVGNIGDVYTLVSEDENTNFNIEFDENRFNADQGSMSEYTPIIEFEVFDDNIKIKLDNNETRIGDSITIDSVVYEFTSNNYIESGYIEDDYFVGEYFTFNVDIDTMLPSDGDISAEMIYTIAGSEPIQYEKETTAWKIVLSNTELKTYTDTALTANSVTDQAYTDSQIALIPDAPQRIFTLSALPTATIFYFDKIVRVINDATFICTSNIENPTTDSEVFWVQT